MKLCISAAGLLLSLSGAAGAETFTDHTMGYSVTMPEFWVREIDSDSQHTFLDTSDSYRSFITIISYDFSAETLYNSSSEWIQANFIANAIIAEADPFCALLFYDTVTARQNDTLHAADMFIKNYDYDTSLGTWCEFIRYTACGRTGYEIYVVGSEPDMDTNIGFYSQIIGSIVIEDRNIGVIRQLKRLPAIMTTESGPKYPLDLLGRSVNMAQKTFRRTPQILLRPRKGVCTLRGARK